MPVAPDPVVYDLDVENGLCTWYGWAGTLIAPKTLSATASSTATGSSGAGCVNVLRYSLDSGSTWTNLFSGGSSSSTTYTATIPSGQNLSNVRVQASSDSTGTLTGSSPHQVPHAGSGHITVSGLQIA